MSVQKRRYRWLSVVLVILPLTALLSGCGNKATSPNANGNTALTPEDQQKAAAAAQRGVASEEARRQAEKEYMANKKNAGKAP